MSESSLPPYTAAHLRTGRAWDLPGSTTHPCEGAAFHSPRPMFTHLVSLVRVPWPDDRAVLLDAPKAHLCGTCRDKMSLILQMLRKTNGALDWEVRREFGNELRALAMKGWEWFEKTHPDLAHPDAPQV